MKLEHSKNGDYFIPEIALSKASNQTTDQIKWVGLMNTVKAQVEEIIFAELIYGLPSDNL